MKSIMTSDDLNVLLDLECLIANDPKFDTIRFKFVEVIDKVWDDVYNLYNDDRGHS